MGGGSNRSVLFQERMPAPLPTEPQRLLIQLRVLVDGGELDPNQRLGKDQLSRISQNIFNTFPIPRKDHIQCIFPKPMVPGRLLPLVKNFSTRRLIDLQANLITAFEQVLAQPKELHANIFKNLAIQTHSKD